MLPNIPSGIEPYLYYLGVGAAVLITAISKAGFGGGVGILGIPLMALALNDTTHMLGVMLPLLIACDLLSNLHYIGEYDWKRLRFLLPGAAVGIAIGTAILWRLQDMPAREFSRYMEGLVGGICLGVVLLQVFRLFGLRIPTLPPHPMSAASVGGVAGAVSTLNHSAGPIVQVYLLQEKLEKRKLVGTLLLYFLIGNTSKLPTYCLLPMNGRTLINADTLRDSIWFIPLIPLGTMFGAWLNRHVPEKPFAVIMYAGAAAAALQLVRKALDL